MNDVLTYLEEQLAPFSEVPFNAVDSALLAQFCMARGEGVMPRMREVGAGDEAARPASDGKLAALRARLARWRDRGAHLGRSVHRRRKRWEADGEGVSRAGIAEPACCAGGAGSTGTAGTAGAIGPTSGADAVGPTDGESAAVRTADFDAGADAAAASDAAERDRLEMAQDAQAPTEPVRFADLMRAELFSTMFSGMHAAQMKQQLFLMAASPRYRDLLIYDHVAAFDEVLNMQFAATTFVCPGQFVYVGFRGTDTTLTGWREDFNMAYMVPVPAQDVAARYLAAVAADVRVPGPIIVGGHSKGGNLAEYAALTAAPAVQDRIAHVYNHDGPGFIPGTFSAADYAPLAGRMTKQVPEDSMVGILMTSQMPAQVVRATGRGFEQHSVYRWEVAGGAADDRAAAESAFATLPALPERTQRRAQALGQWLASMDGEGRKRTVDALFNAVKAAGVTDAAQLFEGGHEWAILRDGVMRAPMQDRTAMLEALRGITRAFSDVTAERNNARRAHRKQPIGSGSPAR
ncbi:Mbeg1-like protein [Adlercreutzia sp. R25]|uniref:Mbeg1-like protein n=1 Tax=Adlercreutzia shanghongiae TaxID=3111773 RepID=UPI002DBE1F5B|nr:Mbeg1-like protein [Adlercreutzia sp. R25]MEC4273802.1 Mbeg1-like protein [Adlercreutzia sp. R25]